mmetsp:Transcript_36852/g.115896  ORF Transcript_36852/g.115896 Transcript_36852/m.115896 type:complete len:219 (-) Transcript_36852:378-1034(-)
MRRPDHHGIDQSRPNPYVFEVLRVAPRNPPQLGLAEQEVLFRELGRLNEANLGGLDIAHHALLHRHEQPARNLRDVCRWEVKVEVGRDVDVLTALCHHLPVVVLVELVEHHPVVPAQVLDLLDNPVIQGAEVLDDADPLHGLVDHPEACRHTGCRVGALRCQRLEVHNGAVLDMVENGMQCLPRHCLDMPRIGEGRIGRLHANLDVLQAIRIQEPHLP